MLQPPYFNRSRARACAGSAPSSSGTAAPSSQGSCADESDSKVSQDSQGAASSCADAKVKGFCGTDDGKKMCCATCSELRN